MTVLQLKQIAPSAKSQNCELYAPILTAEMMTGGINTQLRICHFLAQALHESGSLNYVRELASGKAYEGRKDLGNIVKGDGVKFKGRGLIQITGRANYETLSKLWEVDLLDKPELLEQPEYAVKSAIWFWNSRCLNKFADTDNIRDITRRINGGFNGLADRMQFLDRAKKILMV
jgi:putative chitinase